MTGKAIILIVDDAPANIQVLAACLKDDYHIKVATDGVRCLTLAKSEPKPDLILLDISMPGMDGYEVCKKLKSDISTNGIPVIFVTAMDSDNDEELGLKLGAIDYITKPIRPAIVRARVASQIIIKQQSDALRDMALRDYLTGLFNRHYLMEVASQKISRAIRHQQPLALIMLDIDHFKQVNDQHGHQVGDAVLEAIAAILQEKSRAEDVVARFGGEEFVILLDNCNNSNAMLKAEALRKEIEQWKPKGLSITASFGVALLSAGIIDLANLIKQADDALYQAKDQGRNQVVFYQEKRLSHAQKTS